MNRRDSIKTMVITSLASGLLLEGCIQGEKEVIYENVWKYKYGRTPEELQRDLEILNQVFFSKEEINTINFDIPDASILVKTRDGSQIPTQRVLFVKNSDGTYYVKNTNKADVFKLESDVVETFVLQLDSYVFPEETLP